MILKIFSRDLKKIFTNSMAIILAVGIAVLPSLYAWINIYANWDPYGSTGNMQVAVIVEDEGYTYKNIDINVGEQITTNLKGNKAIDWQFVSKEDGMKGVEESKYYAAIYIPKNFSKSLTSIMTSNFEQPKITYYANEKKNAIATKITDKVVQTVQTEVNESFVQTVVNVLEKLLGTVVKEVDVDTTGLFTTLSKELNSTKKSIKSVRSSLDALNDLTSISKELNDSLSNQNISELLDDTDTVIENSSDVIKMTQKSVSTIVGSIETVMDDASVTLNESAETIEKVGNTSNDKIVDEITKVYNPTVLVQEKVEGVIDVLKTINEFVNLKSLENVITKVEKINNDLKNAIDAMDRAMNSTVVTDKSSSIAESLKSISNSLSTVTSDYNKKVKPQLQENVNSLLGVLGDLSNVLDSINSDIPLMQTMVSTLNNSLSAGDNVVTSLTALLDGCNDDLDLLINKLNSLSENEILNTLINLTNESTDDVGAFLACPVEIDTEKVYSIENYGSAMAPFYSTLAIWVGAIILVAILKTNVKNKKQLGNVKPHQEFFGRGLTFVLFAVIQAVIICAGDLLFLGIQCYHPILFMIAGVFAAVVFSFFIYALVSAWGEIGKSIAVILLVLQLSGSGGTFPIDVTPKLFRAIYDYLPFTYVINAMRECICGTYSNDYWIDLLKLCAYLVVSLVIGIFFRFVFKNPVKFFNKKIEETGLL